MFRMLIIAITVHLYALGASAQSQQLPPDLEGLPAEIKSLKWKTIDIAGLSTLDHCRALLLLNHSLDELAVNATSEADLMSTYIEKQNLGSQFANTPPPPAAAQLSYDDVQKIAVALLRGPMSQSFYATELGDVSATGLASYAQLYERTCQRRWSELDEARTQVNAMASFLGNGQKLQDYEGWAIAEAALRQKQYEQRVAANPAQAQNAAAQQKTDAQMQALERQNQQLQQALGMAHYQQQAQSQQVAQAQQAAAQAQQQAGQAQQQANQWQQPQGYVVPSAYGYGAYGGYGYGYGTAGAAAAGAYAGATAANANERSNVSPAAAAAAGQYHGSNSSWNHDAGYSSAARSQTEQRMSSFHGAPAAGRR
jgi:hypothetical protein